MSKNKRLEELMHTKLKQQGVSEKWINEHLIVDDFEDDKDDEDCEFCGPKENCTGYKCWIR